MPFHPVILIALAGAASADPAHDGAQCARVPAISTARLRNGVTLRLRVHGPDGAVWANDPGYATRFSIWNDKGPGAPFFDRPGSHYTVVSRQPVTRGDALRTEVEAICAPWQNQAYRFALALEDDGARARAEQAYRRAGQANDLRVAQADRRRTELAEKEERKEQRAKLRALPDEAEVEALLRANWGEGRPGDFYKLESFSVLNDLKCRRDGRSSFVCDTGVIGTENGRLKYVQSRLTMYRIATGALEIVPELIVVT